MIEKSLYENYQIAFSDNLKPDFEDYLFVFNDNRELFLTPKKELPKTLDEFDIEFCLFIGKYNSKNCFVVNARPISYCGKSCTGQRLVYITQVLWKMRNQNTIR